MYCIFLSYKYSVQYLGDTLSYIAAWEILKEGQLDEWRTPVYPLILGIFKTLFGDTKYLQYVVLFQHFIFLISIKYFDILSF